MKSSDAAVSEKMGGRLRGRGVSIRGGPYIPYVDARRVIEQMKSRN
jgi:hypothetical protein